jgi:hypothetical protein
MTMVVQPLRELSTLANLFLRELPKVCGPFLQHWQFVQRLCGRWHIAGITARYVNSILIAKFAGSGEPVFTSMDALLYFEPADLQKEKGFATISLGLICHSIVSTTIS